MRLIVRTAQQDARKLVTALRAGEIGRSKVLVGGEIGVRVHKAALAARRTRRGRLDCMVAVYKFKVDVILGQPLTLTPERHILIQIGNAEVLGRPLIQRILLAADDKAVVLLNRIGVDAQGIEAVFLRVVLNVLERKILEIRPRLIVRRPEHKAVEGSAAHRTRIGKDRSGKAGLIDNGQLDKLKPQIIVRVALALAPERGSRQEIGEAQLNDRPFAVMRVLFADQKIVVRLIYINMYTQAVEAVFHCVLAQRLHCFLGHKCLGLICVRLHPDTGKGNTLHLTLEVCHVAREAVGAESLPLRVLLRCGRLRRFRLCAGQRLRIRLRRRFSTARKKSRQQEQREEHCYPFFHKCLPPF